MKIGPQDMLKTGTTVSCNGKLGTVIKAETVQASNGGVIVVHTVHFILCEYQYNLKGGDKP